MKYIIALLLTFGAFAAQATTPTKRISLDIGRPENTFVLGPISRGSSEYIDCALYVRGTAYPTNDLSGSLWYSVANTSTTGVSISTVDADVINGHVYIQMSVTDSLGLSTTEADYPITYYASVVLTNATQTHVFDVGTLVLRWDAATASAGSATLSNGAQPTYFTALTDTPSSYTGQGGKVVSVNTGGTALEFTTAGSGSGDLTAVQVSGSILTVASGTGPIPIVGLTTAAVQAAQITYTAATNLILSGTEFSLDGSGVASLALADSALQSYTETDPIWIAVSNTVTANALLGSTALQTESDTLATVLARGNDANGLAATNILEVKFGSGGVEWGKIVSSAGSLKIHAGDNARAIDLTTQYNLTVGATPVVGWDTGRLLIVDDATTGAEAVGWSVLTNQIALLAPAGGGATPAFTNAAGNTYSVADLSGAQDGNGIVYSFTLGGWTNSANRVMQNGDSPTALDATAWRTLYSDGSGNITELALGTSGQHLKSNGASSAPTWETPAAAGESWTDRGDEAGWDFLQSDLTTDNTWRDMDLSSIIGTNQATVFLRVSITETVGRSIQFRENGNTTTVNASVCVVPVSSQNIQYDINVRTDTSGIIEYKASNVAWSSISILVKGWIK